MDKNRKTNVPIKDVPRIVEWLLYNCSTDEIFFMASLANNRRNFALLKSILDRLSDYNVYQVFYGKVKDGQELSVLRAQKYGEVAGLQAFAKACLSAQEVIKSREEGVKKRRNRDEE